jgi:hypothetical protein
MEIFLGNGRGDDRKYYALISFYHGKVATLVIHESGGEKIYPSCVGFPKYMCNADIINSLRAMFPFIEKTRPDPLLEHS